MRKIVLMFLVGIFSVGVLICGPLFFRELRFSSMGFQQIAFESLPSFDFHVKKDTTSILQNAEAALNGIYTFATPSITFPAIDTPLKQIWHERSLASSNTHELYIHSLSILWDLYYAHQITGEDVYLDTALNITASWIKENNRWRPTTNIFIWGDHSTAERTIAILYLWDYAKSVGFSTASYDGLISAYCNQATHYLSNPQNYITQHNHGIFEDIALLLLSYHMQPEEAATRYSTLAVSRFQKQIKFAFSENSLHLENSPGYHFVVTNIATFFTELAQKKIDLPARTLRTIKEAQKLKGILLMPDGNLPPIGDTNTDDNIGSTPRIYPTIFADSLAGCLIVSTADQYIYARSKGISKTHSHDDALSFIYAVQDGLIITETGFLSYENTPERLYTKSYLAHNGVFPQTFEPFEKSAFIRSTGSGDSVYYAQLELRSDFGTFDRQFILDDSADKLTVVDSPAQTSSDEWTMLFQLSNQLTALTQIDSFNIRFRLEDQKYHIASNTPVELITAQQEPKIGWKAKTLEKLHPAITILKKVKKDNVSLLVISPESITSSHQSIIYNDIGSMNLKPVAYQRGNSLPQRPKILWGTQSARRVYIFLMVSVFLVISLLGILALFAIKSLRNVLPKIALIPNVIAILAILYLIFRHIN
ncbi:MAG: heparinase II/III family protein [Candidatus Cloacimonetes bacterium]|nr:heparinase II/III family protein [Candidatus Cloacimonadota bacterium]